MTGAVSSDWGSTGAAAVICRRRRARCMLCKKMLRYTTWPLLCFIHGLIPTQEHRVCGGRLFAVIPRHMRAAILDAIP